MKRFAISALALAAMAGTGLAQQSSDNDDMQNGAENMEIGAKSGIVDSEMTDRFIRANDIIDADIYTLAEDYDEGVWNDSDYFDRVGTDWEDIGEVEDIVISRDGELVGVVASVGGWLDIGDADVVIEFSDLRVAGGTADAGWGDLDLVTRLSEEQLESRQEVNDNAWW